MGHLLLASTAHSARGLMRARWTADDLRRNQVGDWVLTEDEAVAIRRRLDAPVTTKAAKGYQS